MLLCSNSNRHLVLDQMYFSDIYPKEYINLCPVRKVLSLQNAVYHSPSINFDNPRHPV